MTQEPACNGALHEFWALFAGGGSFLRRMRHFWRSASSLALVGAVACGLFLHFREPAYRAATVILYAADRSTTEGSEEPDASRTAALRLKELLLSRTTLDAVALEFALYPEVRRALGTTGAVTELRRHIEFRAPGGDALAIAFVGRSPEEAARVANRLGQVVITQDSELRRAQALVTRDFFRGQDRMTKAGLAAREDELATFLVAHPRFALDVTPLLAGTAIRASRRIAGKSALPDLVALEMDWSRLTRGVTDARRRQDDVQTTLFQAELSANSASGGGALRATIIDRAAPPRFAMPPGTSPVVGFFVAISLLGSLLVAAARTLFDDHIRDCWDLTDLATVLVEIPIGVAEAGVSGGGIPDPVVPLSVVR